MPNPTAAEYFRPTDQTVMRSGATPCFDPGHGSPSAVTPVDMCFHPADEPTAATPVDMCFHPAGEPTAAAPVAMCFHPADEPTDAAPVALCFHPADEPTAAAPVAICFHPADDLATDLHRALTGADERDLAALAGRA